MLRQIKKELTSTVFEQRKFLLSNKNFKESTINDEPVRQNIIKLSFDLNQLSATSI